MVAAAVAAASLACRPQPALGSVALARGGSLHVVDLGSCRDRVVHGRVGGRVTFGSDGRVRVIPARGALLSADGRVAATVRRSGRLRTLRDAIWVTDTRTGRSHRAYSVGEWGNTRTLLSPGPIELLGWSRDDRWIFFAVDPGSSQSIAADGLILQVVAAAGGQPHRIGPMLAYTDYMSWCGGRLVFTGGGDRLAVWNKRLLTAGPPSWRPKALWADSHRAFGSVTCAPDGASVVVLSQHAGKDYSFFHAHWSLWRVRLDGSWRRLTSPPRGYSDASPRFSRDGRTILFVRSRRGSGRLYALRRGRLAGPILSLGHQLGYYDHNDWWLNAAWSKGAR